MKKFWYWIWKTVRGKNKYCSCFCVTCPHYEKCRDDGVME